MRVQEHLREHLLDRRSVMADTVIARRRAAGGVLEPVQRRLPGQRRAAWPPCLELAGQHGQNRVAAKLVVVDEVLVAEREAEHALAHQRRDRMLDPGGIAAVPEAAGETLHQPDRPVGRAEQQRPRIRRDRPAVETRHHSPAGHRCKAEQIRATLRPHRGDPLVRPKSLRHNNFAALGAPMHQPM